MMLTEVIKSFLSKPDNDIDKTSSVVDPKNTLVDLDDDNLYPISNVFFDDNASFYGHTETQGIVSKQKNKILSYRKISSTTDVVDAIDEIVNEIIFSYDDKIPVKLMFNEENDAIQKSLNDSFDKIVKLINIKRNMFQIVKNSYIDGTMVFHCAYDKNTSNGIKTITMIDPVNLYFDKSKEVYRYMNDTTQSQKVPENKRTYSPEEIVIEDFGLYDGEIRLSYLEYALKPANMLRTLEDLLIPLRFSRSISRRVFNVDIGDLPAKRGAEVMKEHQNKFKYKKFYNNETGEVTQQQHITSMVEDYWFSNRSGGKGTVVDVLDESGNLGELDDIIYIAKKLYRSMKIPLNRLSLGDNDAEFDYDTTRVSKEDMKFFMFISRLRQVYSQMFKELLKREVVYKKTMSEADWDEYSDKIEIIFSQENKFIEKMKLDNFMNKLDIYSTAQEYQGKLFSVNTILKDVFKFSDEEIEEEFKKIQKEKENKLYKTFYEDDSGY